MGSMFTIAGAQIDVRWADKAANLARMEQVLEETHQAGAHLTIFPECALAGYCFDSLDECRPYAETVPGPSTERLTATARRLGRYLIFGLLEADGDRVFNACTLLGPDGVAGHYRKVHLPYLGIDRFTTPGDRGFAVWDAGGLRVGMHICYDGAFPEAARVMALDGADLLVLPTNWPPGAECTADCLVNARALENAVYFAAVNRVGTERGFPFIGRSKICDPSGRLLAGAEAPTEAVFYASIDVDRARNKHIVRVPGKHEINRFADRHPEFYGRVVDPVTVRRPPISG
ncbi:MAG: carbon-nitrogen hydrolase family protein [Pirellulales bacterium]